ncbi:Protein phosphatase 1B [Hondaea fermentalgiana]|uniref:Protein phosphatase 1B n=1 Tax=Hondaea fermentalgiana TaxID=2315210 RepID=A0A2R5GG07_9STRA|nr:Protein phosphatase 1B [Hondaea fermentalgiana]|eukprot:GBG26794.1 Protein phosphatase 1B [Hondaea fermentalgiana]
MLSTESTAGKEPQEGLGEDLYGLASVQGPRPSHEDAHLVVESGALGMDAVSAFGVFDGFGGSEISTMLSKTVLEEVQEAMKEYKVNTEDPSGRHNAELIALSMRDGFLKLDEKMVDLEAESGSTLVMMLMTPTHLVIANVGDSRFMLSSKNGTSMFTTKDHKPTDEKEFARIVNTAGGFVEYGRVNGRLAVARAFGASYFKKDPSRGPLEQAVTPEPDLFIFERSDLHDFAILGSDGLWDVFSPHQIIGNVVPFIKPEPTRAAPDAKDDSEAFWAWFAANPTAARPSNLRNLNDVSMQLCVDSLNRGSTDNVTALIIKF